VTYLLAFCYGQVTYSTMFTFGFVVYFLLEIIRGPPARQQGVVNGEHDDRGWHFTSIRDMLPSRNGINAPVLQQSWRDMCYLATGYTWQSLLKLLLTEGEKMVLVSLPSIFALFGWTLQSNQLDDQGVYALVNNLGKYLHFYIL
jgi:hypothetical protein